MTFDSIKKTLSPVAVVAALAATLATAGTFAYLTATASDVNLFAMGKVNVRLEETLADPSSDDPATVGVVENEYPITRTDGSWDVISKDPKVTVSAGSADCWVFVALGKSDNFDSYLSYRLVEGWQPLMDDGDGSQFSTQVTTSGGAPVWYREAPASDADQVIYVLAGSPSAETGQVTVNAGVTAGDVRALGSAASPNPTLSVAAYAMQKAGTASALDAWGLVGA